MDMDDNEIEETARATPPVYDQVIRELNSGYQSANTPAMKEITGVVMGSAVTNPAQNDIIATIAVSADNQSPGYDTGSTQRVFEVGLADIRRLAESAPKYRAEFSRMATTLGEQLEKDVAAYRREVLAWCDQGLPTKEPTAVMRPLRLKAGM